MIALSKIFMFTNNNSRLNIDFYQISYKVKKIIWEKRIEFSVLLKEFRTQNQR